MKEKILIAVIMIAAFLAGYFIQNTPSTVININDSTITVITDSDVEYIAGDIVE